MILRTISTKTLQSAFALLLLVSACNTRKTETGGESKETVVNDTIPAERTSVQDRAVASYSEKVEDPLNDFKFGVDIYETKATFKFLMKIQYMALEEQDTLTVPNFGIMPKVEVRKGPDEKSCIVGFLDKTGAFKQQKLVAVKSNQLKVSTLRHYARTRYKVSK